MKTSLPDRTEVVIIGGGPVGLTASLLLDRFGIAHVVVEAQDQPNDHPQAHFINSRSMEIFRELGLEATIRAAAAPLDEWRHHVYATALAGARPAPSFRGSSPDPLLGLVDHFPSGPDRRISPSWECNLSQPLLQELLRDAVGRSRRARLLTGWRADLYERRHGVEVGLRPSAGGREHRLRCRYVVCADGARSGSRDRLGIARVQRTPTLQHLLNVHFLSPTLAQMLRRRPAAMLYFVYSPHGIGVFVNHSLVRGEFVLQRPYFPPFEDPQDFDHPTCARMIDRIVGLPTGADIRSIRSWRLEAWVAERFQSREGRCFLVGDAAHQILPAGGFGMNTGIAEVHNLAWKLARALETETDNPGGAGAALLATYDTERRPVAEEAIALSRVNYDRTLGAAAAIGLDWRAARWMQKALARLPLPMALRRRLFQAGIRLGLSQIRLLNGNNPIGRFRRRRFSDLMKTPERMLPMRFPRQDLGAVYRGGWLEEEPGTDGCPSSVPAFRVGFETGARLPHFWLQPSGGGTRSEISSLDLSTRTARGHAGPAYTLLLFGREAVAPRNFTTLIDPRFTPLEIVRIAESRTQDANADFVRAGNDGLATPPAVLLRPDGHLAWVAPCSCRQAQAA
ncbi:MAG: FAD-dependent monooxygenase [Desulfobacterales bacterium]|nr:FAD-dependent monooxygenase [Desulfobacterales bacterium]